MAQGNSNISDAPERGPMDQFSAHLDRGWDLINRGDLSGALLSAEKGVELDAQSPEAHNLMGYVRAAQGDAEEALEHYKQALALDDTFVEAMLNAAEVLIHPLHDYEAAFEMVEEALELAEDEDETADALLIRFDAHMHQGDSNGAAQVAKRLPRGPFENPRLDFLVGRALFEVELLEDADPLLRRAIEREPDQPDAYYYLALLLEAKEDKRGATRAFLQTRTLDLTTPEPPFALPAEHFEERATQALAALPPVLAAPLRDALLVISDLPGVELVADGVDPRAGLVMDAISPPEATTPSVGRLFLYKRNIERASEGTWQLQDEIRHMVESELVGLFPHLAALMPAGQVSEDEST